MDTQTRMIQEFAGWIFDPSSCDLKMKDIVVDAPVGKDEVIVFDPKVNNPFEGDTITVSDL